MDIEEDQFHKPSSIERRLRLRKDYKEKSIDNKTQQSDHSNNKSKENNIAGTSQSSCEDDSILDFKSPERIYPVQSKIAKGTKSPNKSKKKILHSKPKIINNKKNLKNSKLLQRRRIAHDVQPSIESSFFKSEKKETDSPQSDSTDTKTAYVCPLCFKNLKDESVQATHMKSCAIKNNVSTKKLMDAVELQERQAAERKSLGLLAAPVLQDKKKPAPRKITSHDDPDLQLALALSKSLYEKEEMEEWDEVQIVAISSGSSLPDNNTDCRQKTTLQTFGFTSDRSASPLNNWPVNKIKRRKPLEPTILQRRTAVERERILTERIAEILMDYRDFTQKVQKEEESDNVKKRIHIKSQLLQQLHQTEDTLWKKTKLTSTQNAFYVQQLSPQIIPSEKEEQKLNEERDIVQLIGQNINEEEKTLDNEEMQAVKTTDSDEGLTISSNAVNICCKEKKFLDSLATSWRNVLNDSSISDVIIFVRNNKHIWAHKLIFYVRCTNVLLDIVSNNDTMFPTAKEKIDWFDTDYDAALAFLEFVYCGVIDKHSKILNSDASLSGVRSLARKYKVNDLFTYLRQREFKSVVAEIEHAYNICEKSTGNVRENAEMASNVPKLDKSAFDASSNYTHDDLKNIQSPQKTLLQEDVNDNVHSLEDSCTSTKDFCLLQDKEAVSISQKLSEELNLRRNRSTNRETSASPDMFDDTLDVTKHSDKFIVHSKDHEDSNIHMLLSLIKQDVDADICSQRLLTRKTRSAECLDLNKDVSARSKNTEQGIIEIDSDFESIDDKNSLTATPQNSKSRCTQDPSYVTKQKSNLTLFIEKMQRENARSDSDLDSDVECPVQIFPVIAKNPFHVDKHDNCEEPQSHIDNIEQLDDVEKKSSRLSIIEQRMRSYANKNPEFYSRPSNEHVEDIKQTSHMSPVSSKGTIESSDSNYAQSFTSPDEKGTNIPEQVDKSSTAYSLCTKTTNRSYSETISDLETKEEELSMYSKYMRDCKDNSIAKYREAIVKSGSGSDLSNKYASDSSDKKSDIDENDEALSRSTLTQKDAEVIVSSDTETESISSDISCRVILQNNDRDDANISSHSVKWSRETTRDSKQDVESEGSDQSLGVEKIWEAATTETDKEKDINTEINSRRDTFDSKNMETTSDDINFGIITQKKFSSSDDQEKESVPSPIMVPSSPDFLDAESASSDYLSTENCLLGTEHSGKSKPVADVRRKSAEFSFNFEQDIYLANVDVNRYEKQVLEKSQSASVLNVTGFKKGSARRCSNINNDKNNKDNNTIANDISYCANLDRDAISMTQSSASVRKFQRKSLSEGQINVNRLCNREAPSAQASVQFNYSHWHNGNKNTKLKVIDKNVTPPPDFDRMSTPELHKEMRKYGLKLQKRSRAVKLLTHIYNELHPLVPVSETGQEVTEISSDDEEPPLKKRNVDYGLEKSNEEDNDDNSLSSQDSDESISSVKGTINREMEFYETESLPVLENLSDITEAFTKLINFDKDLYNKILRYEPVNIEQLRSTLQTHGFKCKLSNLMSFLDEQCITFYMPEQSVRSRTRKKA